MAALLIHVGAVAADDGVHGANSREAHHAPEARTTGVRHLPAGKNAAAEGSKLLDDLIVGFDLNEGQGGTADDVKKTGRNALLKHTVWLNDKTFGKVLDFSTATSSATLKERVAPKCRDCNPRQPAKQLQHERAQNSNTIQLAGGYAVVAGQGDFFSHFRSTGENARLKDARHRRTAPLTTRYPSIAFFGRPPRMYLLVATTCRGGLRRRAVIVIRPAPTSRLLSRSQNCIFSVCYLQQEGVT